MQGLNTLNILLIVESEQDYLLFKRFLTPVGINNSQIVWIKSIDKIPNSSIDLTIFEFNLPESQRQENLKKLWHKLPITTIFLFTKNPSLDFAIDTLKEGVLDVLVKGNINQTHIFKALNNTLEKHKSALSLSKAQKEFENIFDQSPIPFFIFNKINLKIIAANQSALEQYGYTLIEFHSMKILDVFQKSTLWTRKKILDRLKETKTNTPQKFIHLTKSKDLIHVEIVKCNNSAFDTNLMILAVKNISEVVSDQKALLQSEKKYQILFGESPLPKFLCKAADLLITQTNKEADKLLALSGNEIKYFHELFDISDQDSFKNLLRIKKRESVHTLGIWTHSSAQLKENIVLQISMQELDVEGEGHIMFACSDITELETTKNTLKTNVQRFQLMLKATNNAVWDYKVQQEELIFGDNFNSLFGNNPDNDNSIEAWVKRIHPDDRSKVLQSFNDALNEKLAKWQSNYRFKKTDGSYAHVFDQCTFVKDEKGQIVQAIGAMQDVSKYIDREHQLHLMEKVVESANDPILITEAEPINNPGPRIVYANNAFLKQTGYSREEILGKSPRILQGPKSNKKELERLKLAMENWEPCQIETINYKKNGEEYWVEFSVVPIANENGWFTNFISIQRQTSERKKNDEIREIFQRINMAVSQPKDLTGRFEALLRVVLEYTNLKMAEGWIMNIDNSRLNKVTSCTQTFDFDDISEMKNVFSEVEIGIGLPGSAWEKGKIIIWEDLKNHPGFTENKSFLKYELKTAVAIPVYHDKFLVGVITLFSQRKKIELISHFMLFEKISLQLGAELKRMKTEDELKTIFDLTPNLLFITNYKGDIKKGNLQTAKTLNCTEKDLIDKSFRKMIPQDYQAEFDQFLANLNKTKTIEDVDVPLLINDQLKWINISATLLSSGFFIYCVGKDITKQKGLEELLNRTHEIVRMGTWEINIANNSVYWSHMTRVIHELDDDYEPELQTAINFYKEGYSRDLIEEKVGKAIKGEIKHFEVDAQIVTFLGNSLWVRIHAESEWLDGKLFRIYGSIQDINERKKVEEEVTEAKMRYDLASKAAIIGIWDWNIVSNTLIWDKTMKELYGIDPNNKKNSYQLWQNGLHPDEREKQNEILQEALAGKSAYNTQFRIVLPITGEIRYLKSFAYVVRNEVGEPVRMVGVNYDITDEVEYKLKLERANFERKMILESITDGFFSVNKDWIVTYWNTAAESILKMPRENILGKSLWEIYEDALHLEFFTEFSISMEKGEERCFVEYYPTVDIWLECSTFPKENGIVVYMKDITARIKQHTKLAEVKLLQEHVINSTEDLIWAIDDNFILILANNAFFDEMERVTGHRFKLGEPIINFSKDQLTVSEDNVDFWEDNFTKVLAGTQLNLTFKSGEKELESKTYQIGLYPIIDKDTGKVRVSGAACFARDITDRVKHISAIERQNEKLREISWKQSHVVRAPVARIMGLINLQNSMNYSGEELQEILDYIMDSSKELDRIIRDISDRSNQK